MNPLSRYELTLLTQLIAEQQKRRRADVPRQQPLYDTVLPPPNEPVPSVYDSEDHPLASPRITR